MAAWGATTSHKHAICIADPAEGKTFSMLHMARHLIKKDTTGKTEVVIHCPNAIIANQCRKKLRLFDIHTKVTVTNVWAPALWQ